LLENTGRCSKVLGMTEEIESLERRIAGLAAGSIAAA
jgi:hypothetical protein